MHRTQLIVSHLRDTWPTPVESEKTVFLGEWCFCHSPPFRLDDQHRYFVVPYPWSNGDALEIALREAHQVANQLEPLAGAALNRILGTNHDLQFWRLRLAPWILNWIGMGLSIYRRLEWIEQNLPGPLTVRLPMINSSARAPGDGFPVSIDPLHHHSLIDDILTEMNSPHFRIERHGVLSLPSPKPPTTSISQRVWSGLVSGSRLTLGHIPGMKTADKLALLWQADPLFIVRPRRFPRRVSEPRELNEVLPIPQSADRWTKIAARLLLRYLPHDRWQEFRGSPPSRWIGLDLYGADEKAWQVAATVESGGEWFSPQHGACYGQLRVMGTGRMESHLSQGFLSWGWKNHPDQWRGRIIPLPSPKLSRLPRHRGGNDEILYVSNARPLLTYRIHSDIMPNHLLDYIQEKKAFFRGLPETLRQRVIYRPYENEYGSRDFEILGPDAPPHVLRGPVNLLERMKDCRLLVIDHLGTTLLEALVMEVPVLAFWHPQHIEISNVAKPFFDQLKSAGILHESAASASRKLQQLTAEDVASWWSSASVRRAVEAFKNEYCLADPAWREKWRQFLTSTSSSEKIPASRT